MHTYIWMNDDATKTRERTMKNSVLIIVPLLNSKSITESLNKKFTCLVKNNNIVQEENSCCSAYKFVD